jgi:hypothetical protein
MSAKDSNQNFRDSVALSMLADPRPTLENLARNTGLSYEEVVDHALVRYASPGAEAQSRLGPQCLARADHRTQSGARKVGSIIDWLEAGLESTEWH